MQPLQQERKLNARDSWDWAWRTARCAKKELKNGTVTERDALFIIANDALRNGLPHKALPYAFDKALDGSAIGEPSGSFRRMESSVRVVRNRVMKWRPKPVGESSTGVSAAVIHDGVNTTVLIKSPSVGGRSWRIDNSPTGYDCHYWDWNSDKIGVLVDDYAHMREFSSMNKRISDGLEALILELHEEISDWASECWLEY